MKEANDRFMTGLCLHCQRRGHRVIDCQKEDFIHGTCCFWCGLPCRAYGEEIHGVMATAECEEGLRDIIVGSYWHLYRNEGWISLWFSESGLGWMSEDEFKEWVVRKEGEFDIVNGVRLVIAAWRDKHDII